MIRADIFQREAFRRLCRLNRPETFGHLRALYRSAMADRLAGAFSGYSP